jgi:probable phosphoglycerate mutase
VLTAKGRAQANVTKDVIAMDTFDVCLRSPLARARETADIAWGTRAGTAFVDVDDLREIDLYAFEGLFKEDGMEKYGESYANWKKNPRAFEIDGHYPVRELWDRATRVWNETLLARRETKILVVAHNAVNQALIGSALGLGPEYFRRIVQSNCAVSRLIIDEGFEPNTGRGVKLEVFNQTPEAPVGKKDAVVLVHEPTSIEEEAKITRSMVNVLKNTSVGALLHSPDGPAARLAEKVFDRCQREMSGECPFEANVVNSVDDILTSLADTPRNGGSTFIIHEKAVCQDFLAHVLERDSGEIFSLSPGGMSVINMKGGPAKDPVAVCINYLLHLPSIERAAIDDTY